RTESCRRKAMPVPPSPAKARLPPPNISRDPRPVPAGRVRRSVVTLKTLAELLRRHSPLLLRLRRRLFHLVELTAGLFPRIGNGPPALEGSAAAELGRSAHSQEEWMERRRPGVRQRLCPIRSTARWSRGRPCPDWSC